MFRLAGELAAQGKRILTTTTTKILTPGPEQSPQVLVVAEPTALIDRFRTRAAGAGHFTAARTCDPETGKLIGFAPETIRQVWQTGGLDWIIVEADGARRRTLKAWAPHEPVLPGVTTRLVVVAGLDGPGSPLDEKHVFRPELFARQSALPLHSAISAPAVATVLCDGIRTMSAALPRCKVAVVLNKADTAERLTMGRRLAGLIAGNGPTSVDRVVITALRETTPVKNRRLLNHGHAGTAGVILAAGCSRRMGETKQLLAFNGTTLLGQAIRTACAANLDPVIVVLGHDRDAVADSLDGQAIRIVVNPHFAEGQAGSLRVGIRAVPKKAAGAVVLLADQPLLKPESIVLLTSTFAKTGTGLVVPTYRGRRGTPVVIGRDMFAAVMTLCGDTGARALFDTHREKIQFIETGDVGVIRDIDSRRGLPDTDGIAGQREVMGAALLEQLPTGVPDNRKGRDSRNVGNHGLASLTAEPAVRRLSRPVARKDDVWRRRSMIGGILSMTKSISSSVL